MFTSLLFVQRDRAGRGGGGRMNANNAAAGSSELHPPPSTQLWAQCYTEQRMQKSASQSSATEEEGRKNHPAVSLLPPSCFTETRNGVCSRPGSSTDAQSSSKGGTPSYPQP